MILGSDWASLLRSFKTRCGQNIHETRSPAQPYYHGFEDRFADGLAIAEPLSYIVSLSEEPPQKDFEARAFEASRYQPGQLTIQTRRRYVSAMPATMEVLRTKCKVMTNVWLPAVMRQPGRQLYLDRNKDTFIEFLDELVSRNKNAPPSLPLLPNGPFFSGCAAWGSKKTWKFESTKNRQSTQWVDQKCMLFKHVFSGICFSPKETCTLQKCIFFKMGFLTLDCFLPFAGRSKNKISQKAPFWFFFFGEAEVGPGAHFRIRRGPFRAGRCCLCLFGVPWSVK